MDIKYNQKAKSYFKVMCFSCGTEREIYRIGGDNTKKFWCSNCRKSVHTALDLRKKD